ncbi:MAG: PH domain-containing protein [bacterium]
MSLAKKIKLREGERIVGSVRRYGLVSWWKYLFGIIVLSVAALFMFQLFSYGWYGYGAFGAGALLGLYILSRTWFFDYTNILIISNERIVDIHRLGWFDQVVSSVSYSEIKDVSVRKKGILANLFNYGSVMIHSKSDKFYLEVVKIHNPQELQNLLNDASERYKQGKKLLDANTIYKNFIKIIPDLTDDQLNKVNDLILNEFEELDESEEITKEAQEI